MKKLLIVLLLALAACGDVESQTVSSPPPVIDSQWVQLEHDLRYRCHGPDAIYDGYESMTSVKDSEHCLD